MDAQDDDTSRIKQLPGESPRKERRPLIRAIFDGQGNKVYLPSRKKKIFTRCLHLRFVIVGTIPSKKNRQIATINHNRIRGIVNTFYKTGAALLAKLFEVKPYIRPAKAFLEWEEKVSADIVLQAARWKEIYSKHDLVFPIKNASVSIYHYWADPKERDNSNKLESINDMFVSAGIITNDTWQNLSPIAADADLYKGEINKHVTEITITAYF